MAIYNNDRDSNDIMWEEHHAAVDIPSINNLMSDNEEVRQTWVNVETFPTKEDAIKWAMENLGADENGNICVISTF